VFRGLTHHGRVHLAVVLGAAVATAVLTGALLVGDSVRGSLRDLVLDRLGDIDQALLSERFFREQLAGDLENGAPTVHVAPAILLQGSAIHAGTGARASGIQVLGVDNRFLEQFPSPTGQATELPLQRLPGQLFPSVILNAPLADELDAVLGDAVLISFPRWSEIPSDTLLGSRETEDVVGTLRCTVTGILPEGGIGRFGLSARQTFQKNAFVDLSRLQQTLDSRGQVNALFVAGTTEPPQHLDAALENALHLEDVGLAVEPGDGYLSITSQEFVLRPGMVQAAEAAAAELDASVLPLQTYLANRMQAGERSVPYSMMVALELPLEPAFGQLELTDGTPAPALQDRDILLNQWAAEDLGARVGDTVELTYFSVGPREELSTEDASFTLRGITTLQGLGADRGITPDYPGIQGAGNMTDWDPPFPVNLDAIRPEDETYWDEYGATPKAFVAEETGRQLWSNRFGTVTALRVAPPAGTETSTFLPQFRAALLRELDSAGFGLHLLPVRQEGLEASKGATDFSMLFISFSMFLIFSALMLVSLLFRLGVEQRGRELGLLLAVGFRVRAVRRRFLMEGALLAAAGMVLGLGGAVVYAGLMMTGLRTVWLPAVGSPLLFLHVQPLSLAAGGMLSLLAVLATIVHAIRKLSRVPPTALLAGSVSGARRAASGRLARNIAYLSTGSAAGLLIKAAFSSGEPGPGLFFGVGASVLCAGLGYFSLWCRRVHGGASASLIGMAARNSSWNPGRSILSVALVGSACFTIISVGAFQLQDGGDIRSLESGTGGYALVAESDVPLPQDPSRTAARANLGFPESAEKELDGVELVPFRMLPGDDASCLNLYRPGRPRILGVPDEQIQRGGFPFGALADDVDNPWTLLDQELEPGVIPALGDENSVMWILHLGLGKDLVLQNERGEEIRLRLVGLMKHSLFQSELLISEANFLRHFPSRGGYSYFLIDPPAGSEGRATEALESALGPFGLDVTSTAQRLRDYNAVQNTYLSTFQTLGGLGLLLGTLGLGIILVRNIMERRGELAVLRAFGFRRNRLAVMVLAENVFLLVFGITLGTVSALVAIAPVVLGEGSALPWASLLLTLTVVFLVGMLASLAGVLGTLRVPLLPALKAER